MRVWVISILALVVGISTGLGTTWLEFNNVREYFGAASRTKAGEPPDSSTPSGPLAVVVGGPKFDFGSMNQNETREKVFVIRNEGNKPLEIAWTGESCGMCIQGKEKFTPTTLPPGGQCEVNVIYATKKPKTIFSESAKLTTNDPRNTTLDLQITGFVTVALKLEPESLAVSSISTSEPTTISAKLFGFQNEKLELVKYELTDPHLKDMLELTAKPMDAETIKARDRAQAGLDLQVKLKSGLPIGPLSETIKLTVMTDSEHTLELSLRGTVVGDLTVFGKGYDANTGVMSLGIIKRNVGLNAQFFVLAKGSTRNDVKLSVREVDPSDWMKVTIEEPTAMADGKAVKFPVKVSILKGLPTMNRLGNDQGAAAKIVLDTNHASAKELTITVRFATE